MDVVAIRRNPFQMTTYRNAISVVFNYETNTYVVTDSDGGTHSYSKANYIVQILL